MKRTKSALGLLYENTSYMLLDMACAFSLLSSSNNQQDSDLELIWLYIYRKGLGYNSICEFYKVYLNVIIKIIFITEIIPLPKIIVANCSLCVMIAGLFFPLPNFDFRKLDAGMKAVIG